MDSFYLPGCHFQKHQGFGPLQNHGSSVPSARSFRLEPLDLWKPTSWQRVKMDSGVTSISRDLRATRWGSVVDDCWFSDPGKPQRDFHWMHKNPF